MSLSNHGSVEGRKERHAMRSFDFAALNLDCCCVGVVGSLHFFFFGFGVRESGSTVRTAL